MSPRFEPWIGSKYETIGIDGVRVLAIGESHYGDEAGATSRFTSEVVNDCVYLGRHPFFTKVAKLILGMQAGQYLTDVALRDAWERIAFYNYVQHMLPAARIRPTESMWQEAEQALPNVLARLQPEVVIVMGKELGGRFPASSCAAAICFTEHPSSSRFRYQPWVSGIQAAINASLKAKPVGGLA